MWYLENLVQSYQLLYLSKNSATLHHILMCMQNYLKKPQRPRVHITLMQFMMLWWDEIPSWQISRATVRLAHRWCQALYHTAMHWWFIYWINISEVITTDRKELIHKLEQINAHESEAKKNKLVARPLKAEMLKLTNLVIKITPRVFSVALWSVVSQEEEKYKNLEAKALCIV